MLENPSWEPQLRNSSAVTLAGHSAALEIMEWQRQRRRRTHFWGGAPDPAVVDYAFNGAGGEILAYLNYAIVNGLPEDRFAPNVILHFRERLYRTITLAELEDKLRLFFATCCAPDRSENEWRDIYTYGIEALPRLDEQKVTWVKNRSLALQEILDHEGSPRMLRSAAQASPSFRRRPKRKSSILHQDVQSRAATPQRVHNHRWSPKQRAKRGLKLPVSWQP